jgi:phosphotransacetylase
MTHDGEFSSCRNLDFLLDRCRDGKRMRIAAVCAQDEDVLVALNEARRQGIVEGVLVGDRAKIERVAGTVGSMPERSKSCTSPVKPMRRSGRFGWVPKDGRTLS